MDFDKAQNKDDLPERKRIRLKDYDYSQNNYYFVTMCTHEKRKIFGMGESLTEYGLIAEKYIYSINEVFNDVKIDKFVIMPNHIHAIVVIERKDAARMYACPTLGTVIGNYKASVTREIHLRAPSETVWQKRFYEHIIRNRKEYETIWEYIDENPIKWHTDKYYRV